MRAIFASGQEIDNIYIFYGSTREPDKQKVNIKYDT